MKIHFTDGDKVKYFSHVGGFFDKNNTEYLFSYHVVLNDNI